MGKPSVVVDAVFHSCLKKRCGVDSEFKMFLIRTYSQPSIVQKPSQRRVMASRAGVPTHRATVRLSVVTLHRDAKHCIKGKTGRPVCKYSNLPLQPERRAGDGHAGARRDAQLELQRGWRTHVDCRSLRPKIGASPFFLTGAGAVHVMLTAR